MRIRAMKKRTQNEPNLLDAQMNVTSSITKHYENARLRGRGKNKPNQTQSKPISKAKSRAGAGMTKSSNRQYHTLMYPIFVD